MKKLLFAVAVGLAAAQVFAAARTIQLNVDGMDCAACPITVRKALERIEGVNVTATDLKAATIEVRITNDAVSDAQILKATADAGYPSTLH